ncbi:MAG: hypothetical protein AABZ30_12700, partial [Myxococcota bacterium]
APTPAPRAPDEPALPPTAPEPVAVPAAPLAPDEPALPPTAPEPEPWFAAPLAATPSLPDLAIDLGDAPATGEPALPPFPQGAPSRSVKASTGIWVALLGVALVLSAFGLWYYSVQPVALSPLPAASRKPAPDPAAPAAPVAPIAAPAAVPAPTPPAPPPAPTPSSAARADAGAPAKVAPKKPSRSRSRAKSRPRRAPRPRRDK